MCKAVQILFSKKSLGDDPLEWLPAVDAEHQTHCVRACVGAKLCALALALDAMYDTMYAKNGFGVFWLGPAACDREGKPCTSQCTPLNGQIGLASCPQVLAEFEAANHFVKICQYQTGCSSQAAARTTKLGEGNANKFCGQNLRFA